VTTFTGLPPVQVLLSQMPSDDCFAYNRRDTNSLGGGETISTFLKKFISFFIYRYSMKPGTHNQVTLLDPLSFSRACVLSYIRADTVVVFSSAAVAALLSEQM
jgi:hypothetical protein